MKKRIGVFLRGVACCLMLAALVACGGDKSGGDGVYTINMMLLSNGTTPDVAEVQAAVNERIKEDGIKVEFVIMDWSFVEQINLMVSGGEKIDFIPVWGGDLGNDVAQGKLLPLSKLLDGVGKPTKDTLGEYLQGTTFKGEVYALPTIRDMPQSFGICAREDILLKYGYNIKDLTTVEKWEEVFTNIAPKEPEITMLYTQGSGNDIIQQMLQDYDSLGMDSNGVLMNRGQDIPFKVVNYYDTPEYEQRARMIRRWYQNGWIVKDATTNPQGGSLQVGAGKLLAFTSNLKPGFDAQSSLGASGVKMVQVDLAPAVGYTSNVASINWGIPITCKNPEKTMLLINRLYTDPVVWNLINWGIEGKHYVKMNDHIATYAPGVDASNSGYVMNLSWFYGNSLMDGGLMWEGNEYDVNEQMKEFNRTAIFSKAMGFNFDSTPVRNAITSVQNVINEYRLAMGAGMLDVNENLPKFRKAMKDAGVDEIVAEKQKQLDAWAHEKGLY
ncbi:ABC transporter substrate-binding protein [Spirochaetia bacterium]|nr:ABC transporter substrate-binding protein [Spirochaetia bacterium]